MIKIVTYQKHRKEFIINPNCENKYLIKFLLEKELIKIRKKINYYLKIEAIDSQCKSPNVLKRQYIEKVNNIVESRNTILKALQDLRKV
jgi:hypothetical protein